MKTEQIKALLEEAAFTLDGKRVNAIHVELRNATCAGAGEFNEIDTPAAGVITLIDHLYVELWETNPALLPSMWPVFVLACGDRDSRSFLASLEKQNS